MANLLFQQTIDASVANAFVLAAVGDVDSVSVQVSPQSGGTSTGATYTVKRSLDQKNWVGFPLSVVILGNGITRRLDVRATPFIRVEVSTADGSGPAMVLVTIWGE